MPREVMAPMPPRRPDPMVRAPASDPEPQVEDTATKPRRRMDSPRTDMPSAVMPAYEESLPQVEYTATTPQHRAPAAAQPAPWEADTTTSETAPARSFSAADAPRQENLHPPLIRSPRRPPTATVAPRGDVPAATPTSISDVKIDYFVRAQPIEQVLREIGQMAGVNVITGNGLRGTVQERRLEGRAEKVLDQLSREFSLFWFHDGLSVYVDPLDEQRTRQFKVRGANPSQIARSLEDAGLGRYRSRIQLVGKDGLVRVTGPDSFTNAVEAALTETDVDTSAVQVIRFGQRGR